MIRLAWAQIKHSPSRLLAVLLAVILSAAMLAGTVVFSATSTASIQTTTAAPLTPVDVVIDQGSADQTTLGASWAQDLLDQSEVASQVRATTPLFASTPTVYGPGGRGSATVYSIARDPSLKWFGLNKGSWPTQADQIIVSQDTASDLGVTIGDTITLKSGDGSGRDVHICAINDITFKPMTGTDYAMYADSSFFADAIPTELFIKLNDPTQAADVARRITATAKDTGFEAYTGKEVIRQSAARLAGGSTQLTVIMAVFALIAMLCAMMVISSTYKTLIAQRTRNIAMLRLIGARRANMRTLVLQEALLTGVGGALIGGLLGAAVGYGAMVLTHQAFGGFAVNPILLACVLLLTVLATVTAAWTTTRQATRIPPIQALEGATVATGSAKNGSPANRRRIITLACGVTLAILAVALLWIGADSNHMPLAVIGGLFLALALVLTMPNLTMLLLPGIGAGVSALGLSGRLAASNLVANARRAGGTVTSIAFGISLIAALASAAATGSATISADNDHRYPVSAVLYTSDNTALSDKILQQHRQITDAQASYSVRTTPIEQAPDGDKTTPKLLEVIPDQAAGTFIADDSWNPNATNGIPVALVHPKYMKAIAITTGDPLTLTVAGAQMTVSAQPSQLTESPELSIIITDSQLNTLQAAATIEQTLATSMIWYKAKPGIDRSRLADQINSLAASDPNAIVGGGIAESTDIMNVLNILLVLSYLMLAITVIISLTGLANQLALSVAERTNEISMLRALGARRGSIRGSIAWEALTLTILGTIVGLLIGLPLGVIGVKAQIGSMTDQFTTTMPWLQIAILVPAILAAALVASTIPARHATRIRPAQGLSS